MPDPTPAMRSRSRRMLLMLAAIFFLPVAVAVALYANGWKPAGSTNHGELLHPIRQLPAMAGPLLGKWTMFYVGDGACSSEQCRKALWVSRQSRISLNKDMPRIGRALFATANCCDRAFLDEQHEGIQVFDLGEAAAQQALLQVLPPGDQANYLFISDPLGNIVLRFDVRNDAHGLLDDMKKLLKLSSIG
jgi:hypothetical protein